MPELRVERAVRTLPIGDDVGVDVACLRARLHWAGTSSLGGAGVGVSAPLAVRRGAGRAESVPWIALGPIGVVAAIVCDGTPTRKDQKMEQPDRISTIVPKVTRAEEIVGAFTAAGTGQGVVGSATTAGDRTIVPLIETTFAGGYGGGGGSDSTSDKDDVGAGGGGGGFARSRTVALAEITPDEVRVKPVVDTTAIVLAALGVVAGLLGVRRGRRRH